MLWGDPLLLDAPKYEERICKVFEELRGVEERTIYDLQEAFAKAKQQLQFFVEFWFAIIQRSGQDRTGWDGRWGVVRGSFGAETKGI